MMQEISENHWNDEDGNPAGGHTSGTGFNIEWQNGPLGRGKDRKNPNGAFVEGVIQAAAGRLQFYQESKFKCARNAAVLDHLKAALKLLNERTADREERRVEGTHKE